VNDTIIVATAAGVIKALVVEVAGNVLTVEPYGSANLSTLGADAACLHYISLWF
jgi:hypothetical protein